MKHDGKHRMRAWIASATASICIMAASVFGADPPRSAPSRWEDVVKAAEKEGEVTVYATNSVGDLQVIWEAFKKKFPKIKLNATGISTTSEIVTKVMAERRAGQFLVDVMLGAPGATYNSFYRGKALDPMPPALVLPEVIDLAKWWKGKHRYVDPENQFVFVYQSSLYGPPVYTNTKLVNLDSIRSVWDILDPKWKGKMIGLWPRANYVSTALLFMYHHPQVGPKFLERLYSEMDHYLLQRLSAGHRLAGRRQVSDLYSLPAAAGARTGSAGLGSEPVSFQGSARDRLQQRRDCPDEQSSARQCGEGFPQLVLVTRRADRVSPSQQHHGRRYDDFHARGFTAQRGARAGAAKKRRGLYRNQPA